MNATVSSGQLCCELCYSSQPDCVLARFREDAGVCELKVNVAPAGEMGRSAQCPLGVFNQRYVVDHALRRDWEGLIVGPCFDPRE